MSKLGYCYILSSETRTLYTGASAYLDSRLWQHLAGIGGSEFVQKYKIYKLVWAQQFPTILEAIAAEKRIKGWTRRKKIALIESINSHWLDLSQHDLVTFLRPILSSPSRLIVPQH